MSDDWNPSKEKQELIDAILEWHNEHSERLPSYPFLLKRSTEDLTVDLKLLRDAGIWRPAVAQAAVLPDVSSHSDPLTGSPSDSDAGYDEPSRGFPQPLSELVKGPGPKGTSPSDSPSNPDAGYYEPGRGFLQPLPEGEVAAEDDKGKGKDAEVHGQGDANK